MLHVSEIGHTRTGHPQDVFQLGEEIEVQVIKVEAGKDDKRPERISLSRRALERDPWRDVAERFPEGTTFTGRVMRLESFGAFIQLAPGVEGLVHISEIGAGRRLNHSKEALSLGQDVEVKVIGIDLTRRRVLLSIAALQEGYVPPDRDSDRERDRGPSPDRGRSAGGPGRGAGGPGRGPGGGRTPRSRRRGGGGGDRGRGGPRRRPGTGTAGAQGGPHPARADQHLFRLQASARWPTSSEPPQGRVGPRYVARGRRLGPVQGAPVAALVRPF